MTDILINSKHTSKTHRQIDRFAYKASDFGIQGKYTGARTKLAIVSSGIPDHVDIGDFADVELFIKNSEVPDDNLGLSTMYAGIICAKNTKGLTGLAQKTRTYYAKCINESKHCNINAVVSSVLWALVQEVDCILLGAVPTHDSEYVKMILEKAEETNIPIFAEYESFRRMTDTDLSILPVKYNLTTKFGLKNDDGVLCVELPELFYTTYLENKYIEPDPSVAALSIAVGLSLLLIQKNKYTNVKYNAQSIYNELLETKPE